MRNNRFENNAFKISITAMLSALSLLFLYLAAVLPAMNATLYFISSMFAAGLLSEKEIGASILMFVVVSILALLMVPNLLSVLPYVFLFGHYGIGKYLIEGNVKSKLFAIVFKWLYFNAGVALIYFFAGTAFLGAMLSTVPLWLVIVIAQACFVVYDFLYSWVAVFYYEKIRPRLMAR